MFNLEFLHVIREFEYQAVLPCLKSGSRILEIGGGTGYQARRIAQDGFLVDSIDVAASIYAESQVFPVQVYDGRTFPFPDGSFDIVYSSNVLEHIRNLPQLHAEVRRVLRPGGYCVHVMPTGAWRFWTTVTHYIDFFRRLIILAPHAIPRGFSRSAAAEAIQALREMAGIVKYRAFVSRHGEVGSALTELVTFSRAHWIRHFHQQNFDVQLALPTGLFYTGNTVLGERIPISKRRMLAEIFGSACVIYKVEPMPIARPRGNT